MAATGEGPAVFRHGGMVLATVVGTAFLLLLSTLAWAQANSGNVVGVAVLSVGLWFVWLAGWGSKVVISGDGVMIDNLFTRHVIPWRALGDFECDGGLVATLADGGRVAILSFGGSLAGAMTGYRGLARKREEMAAACRNFRGRAGEAGGRYHRRIKTMWPVLVAYLVVLEALAVSTDLSHHVL